MTKRILNVTKSEAGDTRQIRQTVVEGKEAKEGASG